MSPEDRPNISTGFGAGSCRKKQTESPDRSISPPKVRAGEHPATGIKMESIMMKEPRLCARPVARLICAETELTVGYMYEWNNGDRQPAWFGLRVKNVRSVPMVEMRNEQVSIDPTFRPILERASG